jgi:hypothetical protein
VSGGGSPGFWGGYYGGAWSTDYVVNDAIVNVETTLPMPRRA